MKISHTSSKFLLIGILLPLMLPAQDLTGIISGQIRDANTGEPLIGANVMVIQSTGLGTATDVEGKFTIRRMPAGTYSLQVSYIGYEQKIIDDISVSSGEYTRLTIEMNMDVVSLNEVSVEAEKSFGSSLSAFEQKQNALEMQDNLSAEQISKTGDGNVASAVRRVTGVTVMDDKFLVVRGLGDRYSSAQLNNVSMPSPEPEKRAVPLDLFSTALVEGIDVAKSYRPDLPGTFGGGNVNIKTKVYPDRTLYRYKIGAGLSTNLTPGTQFVRNLKGKIDPLGFDGGARSIPESFENNSVTLSCCPPDFAENLLDDYVWQYDTTQTVFGTRTDSQFVQNPDSLAERVQLWKTLNYPKNSDFAKVFTNTISHSGLPSSLGLTYGTKYDLSPDLEAGFMVDGNFSGKYSYRNETQIRYAAKNTSLQDTTKILIPDDIQLDHDRYQYSTNLGLNASAGFAWRNRLKLSIRTIFTHTSKDIYNRYSGRSGEIDENGLFINQSYNEKSINLNTVTLNNQFDLRGWTHAIEAKFTFGKSVLYEPFVIKHQYQLDEAVGLYKVYARNAVEPAEIYNSTGNEKNRSLTYDHLLSSRLGEVKFGAKLDHNRRDFERRQLLIDFSASGLDRDSALVYIADAAQAGQQFNHLATADETGIQEGYIYTEKTSTGKGTKNTDAYDADESIDAFYIMFNTKHIWQERLQISFGVRNEAYTLTMLPRHPVTGFRPYYITETMDDNGSRSVDTTVIEFSKKENDLLPALTVNMQLSDHLKLRSSFSRTIARAQFREYAPYEFQPFFLANVAVGYPFLKNTTIENYDLRFDYNPRGMESLSAGIFYKTFENPIEESIVAGFGRSFYQTWQNADDARIIGTEIELRKNLSFLPRKYGFASINTNLTLSRSEVNAPDSSQLYVIAEGYSAPDNVSIFNRVTDKQRPLQGQSNVVFNFSLNYKTMNGYDFNISYNTFSRRLVALSGDIAGSYWELPFHDVNLVARKKIGAFSLSFKVTNLLNDSVVIAHDFNQEIYPTRKYSPGRDFSIGLSYSQ